MEFPVKLFILMVGVLHLFSNFVVYGNEIDERTDGSSEIDVNARNVTSTFLNFGKINMDQHYRHKHLDNTNKTLKNKIDILSRLLRFHIDRLRNKTRQVELVFLVDASDSVGATNFRSELNFVSKLLSDFIVDATAARVAVITFGGRRHVYRNVDQISKHGADDHKCYLLNKQFSNITYTGGGTYTRGALLEALAILEKGRGDASKVIFLITDGFSNGGDPRPAADLLKDAGATVFTFGIRTGNVEELHDIASSPGYTHSYLLDSFAEFEALARRALHHDLKTGEYVPVTSSIDCSSLCATGDTAKQSCCDDLATCTCGTATGHYACICPSGYFGSGLKGACRPCPNGTYASENSAGDSTSTCAPCPDVNHITVKIPATSALDCSCASGFTANGFKCEAITCAKLKVPENGYLVKASACNNVVHAACGIRCRIGFHLTGDSIRLCGKDGIWSGNEPQCLLKTCPALRAPAHGRIKCIHDDYQHQFNKDSTVYPIDTRCQFKCDIGYQLRGSKVRNCLPLSRWDGLKAICKAVKCEPLLQIANGDIIPKICSGPAKVLFATNCTITCNRGFTLMGPSSRSCSGRTGIWSQRHNINRCIDKIPPTIKCPADIVTETVKGQNYAYVNWTIPEVTDNTDNTDVPPPILWTKPHIVFPWKAKIGTSIVVYIAQDASGNKARCKFKIKVLDREPPTIENCVNPSIFYTDLESGLDNVMWDEPVFYDNSRVSVLLNQSHQPGKDIFPIGQTKVFYNATDKYGNWANCVLNITVKDICKNLIEPVNGRLNCTLTDDHETQCIVTCENGYNFAIEPTNFNVINNELLLKCNSSNHTWEDNYLPECLETQIPKAISQEGNLILQGNESTMCENQTVLRQLSNYITNDLRLKLLDICGNDIECSLISYNPECEEDLPLLKNFNDNMIRRRRHYPGYNHIRSTDISRNNKITILKRSKHAIKLDSNSNRTKIKSKRRRERVEIKFKFIGKIIEENFENPRRGLQKLRKKINTMMHLGKLDLLNNRTNQEIAKLALNLHLVFKDPQDLCEPGSVLKKHGCVKCPAGTFYESTTRICRSCPFGQYQDVTASLQCKSCPEHTFTRRMHVKSVKDCIPICRPGYYSPRKRYHESRLTIEPCFMCDIGFYEPIYGQTQCLPCPLNTTTEKRGSTSVNDCLSIYDIDDCRTDPCSDGGQCLQGESGFVCECHEYYAGSKCEEFRNPCDSSPCLNEGMCKAQKHPNNSVTYDCVCKGSYTGANCEIYIDECSTNPCQNNGECVNTENDFTCECKDGFEGQFCEISLDHCELMPCEEDSVCRTMNGTWQCFCKPGFLGRHCNLLPCDWLPCHTNEICINIKEENATRKSYRCECPDGYTGENCTIKIDHCASSPCLNNGNCISYIHNYTCDCPPLFAGHNCEIELSSDYMMHFTKSSTMDYVIMKGLTKDLSQLSVCLWLQSTDIFNYGTVLSYATKSHDNAFTLTDYNGFVLYVNGEKIVTDVKVNDGYWHFLCVTWENEHGSWYVFVDGILKDSGIGLAPRTVIKADGFLVVGQEQDYLGGGFSELEAFVGKLSLLDIWDIVLDENKITILWNSCKKYHGNIVAWAQMKQYIYGDVMILDSPFCRGCPLPIVPFRGNINVSEDLLEVIYHCDKGYVVQFEGKTRKSLQRRCLKHGQWEGYDVPTCIKIKCGYPGYFPRGYIQGRSYSFGDEIYYSCADNYELRGNPHRICNSDGKWIGVPPICIGITCKNLLAPENGDIEYILEENERDDITMIQAGQQLEFKCNPGYVLMGEKYLTCLETGFWDYEKPSCVFYGCPPPREIKHGYIVYRNSNMPNKWTSTYDAERNTTNDLGKIYYYGDIVKFSCYNGYKFHGNHSLLTEFKLQCSVNGSWTGFVPDCVPRTCPWPDRVEGGKLFFKKQDNTMTEIPAELDTTSESNHLTKNENTTTKEIFPEMFVSGTEVIVVCDSEYKLIGDEIRTCTEEEKWSLSVVLCKLRNCSITDHPIFKTLRKWDDKIVFRNDTSPASLESDEKWSSVQNLTGRYKRFHIFIEGNNYGQRVILMCRNNTLMNLDKLIVNETVSNITWTCSSNAKWELSNLSLKETVYEQLLNDSLHICDRSCVPPQIPKHGYIDHSKSTDDITNRKARNSVTTFKCRHGYILEGNEESICLSNGTWSTLPTCKPVICGEPPILPNAILKKDTDGMKSFLFGNMISYQCMPGYRIFGQANLRCLGNGKWSRMNGRCSKISCGKPKIQHGIVLNGWSYLFQDQLTYVCPNGKEQGIIICQADGKWSELSKCNRSENI